MRSMISIFLLVAISICVLYILIPKDTSPYSPLTLAEIRQTSDYNYRPPSRDEQIKRLQEEEWDVLVIGGGATGAGATLDAVSRGLKVAFVEAGDFASVTSSKSTKLIHGGVRYLEQCFTHLDPAYCYLVFEALSERKTFMNMAPHLTQELRIVTPIYEHWWQIPYLYVGLKLYDAIAFISGVVSREKKTLTPSRYLNKKETLAALPQLKQKGLLGCIEYSDGEFNDARMALSVLLTAVQAGAVGANYLRVEELLKEKGQVAGAFIKDGLTRSLFKVRAKTVINATGPMIDAVRRLDDPHIVPIVAHSSGVHIAVNMKPAFKEGILIMKAPLFQGEKLGTVTFAKPFENTVIVGTTDISQTFSQEVAPGEKEKAFLLHAINSVLAPPYQLGHQDITASWLGFRPLVYNPKKKNTKEFSRNHEIVVSPSGLISIAGGKWTTFRKMGEEGVEKAIEVGRLKPLCPSQSKYMQILGSKGMGPQLQEDLVKEYGISNELARHLVGHYGALAVKVLDLGREKKLMAQLSSRHPYIKAEMAYAKEYEMAQSSEDIFQRRLQLGMVDQAEQSTLKEQIG